MINKCAAQARVPHPLCKLCRAEPAIMEYGGYCGSCAQDLADEAETAARLFTLEA